MQEVDISDVRKTIRILKSLDKGIHGVSLVVYFDGQI